MRRPLIVLTGTAMLMSILTGPALAADPPANDLFDAATTVSSTPFVESVDTTGATTDATDAAANANCGAPATEASVWYSLTEPLPGGTPYTVDVSGSSYPAGVIVVTGTPDSFVLQACGPGSVSFLANAGTTYSILAFSDTPGVIGGTLTIAIQASQPNEVSISIDSTGTLTEPATSRCRGPSPVRNRPSSACQPTCGSAPAGDTSPATPTPPSGVTVPPPGRPRRRSRMESSSVGGPRLTS